MPAVLLLGLVSGCGTSRAGFTADADRACAKSANRLAALHRPTSAGATLGYGLDVYAEKDRLLTVLSEMDLPKNDAGSLRTHWLEPARTDLANYFPRLKRLRAAALADNFEAADDELLMLSHAGSGGVDAPMLTGLGLRDCGALFGR